MIFQDLPITFRILVVVETVVIVAAVSLFLMLRKKIMAVVLANIEQTVQIKHLQRGLRVYYRVCDGCGVVVRGDKEHPCESCGLLTGKSLPMEYLRIQEGIKAAQVEIADLKRRLDECSTD